MSSVMPFAFKNVELYVVTANGKPCTRAKEVCMALGYSENTKPKDVLKKHVSIKNKQHKKQLKGWVTMTQLVNWPIDSQKYDYYLNEEGLYEVLFGSQQPPAKKFRKHCCNVMFPHIRKQLVDKMQEDHQNAIEDRYHKIQAIEYENVGLQGEIRAYQAQLQVSQNRIAELVERYVDHCRNPSKDNIVIIVRKHTTPGNDKYHNFSYYISRIQRRKCYIKLRWLELYFPDHEVIVEIDNPNSIHTFNRLEEEEHIERQYNHFRLLDLTRDDLYRRGIAGMGMDHEC